MEFSQPTISVIIPTYNQAHFLENALQSVAFQTVQPFEIILVDDGSTDETPIIARKFNSAVIYIRQENQGLAGSRNTGILQAQGEFVAYLDSDDLWKPDFLKHMTNLAADHPRAALYYSGSRYIDHEGHELPQVTSDSVIPPDKMYHALLRANFINPNSILLRRSVAIEAGLFDLRFRRLQDWEFWLRLLKDGHQFIGTRECQVLYRLHDRSLTTDIRGGQDAVLAIATKHFGPDDGKPNTWSGDKRRMYGGVFRYHAIMSLISQRDWQACTEYIRKGLIIDPTLADDLNLFYELAVGTQSLGFRSNLGDIDLEGNSRNIHTLLNRIYSPPLDDALFCTQRQSHGTAFYALGLAAYNANKLSLCRKYLFLALFYRPDLASSMSVITTLGKSFLGSSALEYLRTFRRS